MTLLNEDNLENTAAVILELDEECVRWTGRCLYQVACYAMGALPLALEEREALTVACIPVTAGNGIIQGFSHVVADILERFAGVRAFVTPRTDVGGFQDAVESRADIVFTADDETCIAYNMRTGVMSDNSTATGRIFATLLELASGGFEDEVLVLGMGKVGIAAYEYLKAHGVRVRWHDSDEVVAQKQDAATRAPQWDRQSWRYLLDATTAHEFIRACHVAPGGIVSAPGVPYGVSPDAEQKAHLVMNEELAAGIIAMFCEVSGPRVQAEGEAGACPQTESRCSS